MSAARKRGDTTDEDDDLAAVPAIGGSSSASVPRGRMIDRLEAITDLIVDSMTEQKLASTPLPGLATALGVVIDRRRRLLEGQIPTQADLIEVIKRHVYDPEILAAIAGDLDEAYGDCGSAGPVEE